MVSVVNPAVPNVISHNCTQHKHTHTHTHTHTHNSRSLPPHLAPAPRSRLRPCSRAHSHSRSSLAPMHIHAHPCPRPRARALSRARSCAPPPYTRTCALRTCSALTLRQPRRSVTHSTHPWPHDSLVAPHYSLLTTRSSRLLAPPRASSRLLAPPRASARLRAPPRSTALHRAPPRLRAAPLCSAIAASLRTRALLPPSALYGLAPSNIH